MTTNDAVDLPDVNVLFAALNKDHVAHAAAVAWLDQVEQFALTPATMNGLLRLLLNPAAMPNTPPPAQALRAIDALRASRGAAFWPDDRIPGALAHFSYALTSHRQVTDLHLLDLAVAHGARLATLDAKTAAALRPSDSRHLNVLVEPAP